MGKRVHVRMAVAVLLVAGAPAPGAAPPPRFPLRLRTGDVDAARERDARAGSFDESRPHVIVLSGPMTPARRARLEGAGVTLRDYLPTNAFIADVPRAAVPALRAAGFVRTVIPFRDEWKIDPAILAPMGAPRAFADPVRATLERDGRRAVVVHLHRDADLDRAARTLDAIPGAALLDVDLGESDAAIVLSIPPLQIPGLARLGFVRFAEELPEFDVRNESVRWIVQSNVDGYTPLYDGGLTGAGQILGIIDTAVTPDHCCFIDTVNPIGPLHRKIAAYNTTVNYATHGTHVAGTAVGDGGDWGATRGVAYGARMVYNSIPSTSETSVYNRFELHRTQGARVHTNSWGSDATTAYNGTCRAIDNFSWTHDDCLVVFSVSNQNTIKNPENAKNCLAVAASDDTPNQSQACYGGKGPTSDGRRKPEVISPGCDIESASGSSGCGTAQMSGTSMASPSVSAIAVLMRQYFMDGFYPGGVPYAPNSFEPSGALLKAMLVNSAVDMTGIADYPSTREGWGRILADNSVYFAGEARRLILRDVRNNSANALSTGATSTLRVRSSGGPEQLRVTLVWHDAPAAVNAAFAPVNNLDLSVHAPAADAFFGNVFASGVSVSGGAPDPLNNVEQVHVSSPVPGVWEIDVDAAAVNTGTQGYAVVVTGPVYCPADFDADGYVTGDDYDAFVAAFEAGSGTAEFNSDGFVTGDDFDEFVEAFDLGC